MDSALRPREIQSRIRAGQSLEEVARASGESAERIQRFATPVLAEREHVAGLALTSSVRRRGELAGHRPLRAVVREQLLAHGVDPDTVDWDAWRNEDRIWTVQAVWTQDDSERVARFQFDLGSRFSVADDVESRWLIAEDEDSFEADELALVRAVGGDTTHAGSLAGTRQADPDDEPTITLEDVPLRFAPEPRRNTPGSPPGPRTKPQPDEDVESGNDWLPRSAATPQEIREELEAEIDAYGVVPEGRSELDVLYDMLSGIAEDSINIYAGLNDPVVSEPVGDFEPEPSDAGAEAPEPSKTHVEAPVPQTMDLESQPTELRVPRKPAHRNEPDHRAAESRAPAPDSRGTESGTPTATVAAAPPVQSVAAMPSGTTDSEQRRDTDDTATTTLDLGPTNRAGAGKPAGSTSAEPTDTPPTDTPPTDTPPTESPREQPTLVDNEPTVQVAPGAAKRRGARKKRASVPTWDEIMFGGPKLD